jgi:hypothetical protein
MTESCCLLVIQFLAIIICFRKYAIVKSYCQAFVYQNGNSKYARRVMVAQRLHERVDLDHHFPERIAATQAAPAELGGAFSLEQVEAMISGSKP